MNAAGRILEGTSAALSDVGRVRANNEDAYGAFPEAGVWCVADGMGGCEDGEVASAAVVDAVASRLEKPARHGADTAAVVADMRAALSSASRQIFARTRERGLSGCGSTFVALVLGREPDALAHALHAGDSRLYRIRGRVIRQITRDHSMAEAAGVRSETALNPMFRNVILRAVGVEEDVTLDDTPFDCRAGDRVLLCSDGLTRMVDDARLVSLVEGLPPTAAVRALVDAANAAGGADNVTAVVVDVRARRGSRLLRWLAVLALVLVVGLAVRAFSGRSDAVADDGPRATAAARLLDEARAMELEAKARMRGLEGDRP